MSKRVLVSCLGFALLFLCWEVAGYFWDHLIFVLPRPSHIFCAIWENRVRLLFHTSVTLKEMLIGFLIALSGSFPLAWMMLSFRSTRAFLQPLFIVIQCIPMFTLAPIMVIWFGWGFTAIVVPTALMIFFPLTLNIYQGLRATPKGLLEFFQTSQATSWQTFFKLRLPWAVPHLFAGFRISSAIAGIGAVAGEWAGAQNGLGILMLESRRNVDLDITFGALFCLTFLSSILYGIVVYLEGVALPPRRFGFLRQKSKSLAQHRVSKFATSAFLFCTLCLVGVGCYPTNEQTQEKTPKTRLLLDWLPNPNHVPLYVGLEKGFFQEEGIDLLIQKMHEEGNGISYLTSKRADLLLNHMPGLLRAAARGAQVTTIGQLIDCPLRGFIYLDTPDVATTADLTGKILGYCIGGPNTAFLDIILQNGKIAPKERKNISIDLISALGTKSVDFIYGGFWNIEPLQFDHLGVRTKDFKIEDLGVPTYPEMIILTNRGSRHSEKEFVIRFQRALQKSIDYCKQNPDKAFADYHTHNPDKRGKVLKWEKKAWYKTMPLLADSQNVDEEKLAVFYHWLVENKIIKRPFDYRAVITDHTSSIKKLMSS